MDSRRLGYILNDEDWKVVHANRSHREGAGEMCARNEFADRYLDFAVTCMRIATARNISDDDRRDLMQMARYWQSQAGGLLKRANRDKEQDKPKMN
jgi:hypothetical protein